MLVCSVYIKGFLINISIAFASGDLCINDAVLTRGRQLMVIYADTPPSAVRGLSINNEIQVLYVHAIITSYKELLVHCC